MRKKYKNYFRSDKKKNRKELQNESKILCRFSFLIVDLKQRMQIENLLEKCENEKKSKKLTSLLRPLSSGLALLDPARRLSSGEAERE